LDRTDHPVRLEVQETMHKSNRFLLLAGVLIVVLIVAGGAIYTWFFVYNACEVGAVQEASEILITQLKTYDGVFQVAATASRTSPDHPVNTLKQIFMDTQEVSVPACMQTAKHELVGYMGTVISAFQAYRAGEADTTIQGLIKQSDVQYANFKAELKAVNKCAPYCIP
jgi:hypothetical protein